MNYTQELIEAHTDYQIDEPKKEPSKWNDSGVLLIALGHENYGAMAANLAASIRFNDPDLKIHLVWAGNALKRLSPKHKAMFTSMSECPKEYYHRGETFSGVKSKTYIWELSPFEKTLFLDVDMVWFSAPDGGKSIAKLFDSLKNIPFTIQNRGFEDLSKEKINEKFSFWCNVADVKEHYETDGKFYDYHSEFIVFDRSAANEKYFALVRQIFDHPKIKHTNFGGDMPDEFAFDIASAILKYYPHKDNYVPIYWHNAEKHKGMPINKAVEQFYGYSMGGSGNPPEAIRHYNIMVKFLSRKFGFTEFHYYTPKKKFLPERAKI